jgi:hypothetical protein
MMPKRVKLLEKMNKECWIVKHSGGDISCNSKKLMLKASDAIQQEKTFRNQSR